MKVEKIRFGSDVGAAESEKGETLVLPIEQKIWNWLSKYARYVGVVLLAAIVAWGMYLVAHFWMEHSAKKHLKVYATMTTLADRVKWAEGSLPKNLKNTQGIVFLENAYALMDEQKYMDSVVYFEKAKDCLSIFPLKEQAISGAASACLQLGKLEEAKKSFLELYKCNSKYLRAQALFGLCYVAAQMKNDKDLSNYKNLLQAYDEGADFLRRLTTLSIVK